MPSNLPTRKPEGPQIFELLLRWKYDSGGVSTSANLIDMNGDGRPDYVAIWFSPVLQWRVFYNTGAGFDPNPAQLFVEESSLSYSPSATGWDDTEQLLLDVNGDGLPDHVKGAPHRTNSDHSIAIPEKYYTVDPNGVFDGPYDLDANVFLCPTEDSWVAQICGGGTALPAGWAIVGAMSVRLNTGSGLADPVYSPSPFWANDHKRANRIRATYYDSTSQYMNTYRDLVDVNADGRPDWVSTGYRYQTGNRDWHVLYNLGDGRFGGPLTVIAAGGPSGQGVNLGHVRPGTIIDQDSRPYLSAIRQMTEPSDQSSTHFAVLDFDGDGLAEMVDSIALGPLLPYWSLSKLRFAAEGEPETKPDLLTEIDDGLGGKTYFRYQPSSDFIATGNGTPVLPFNSWVVTGIRRTDGLCDDAASDWFTEAGNPCLAAGHELVQQIAYADGFFDAVTREFRGFGMVMVHHGLEGNGSERHLTYYQDDARKGKIETEELRLGSGDVTSRKTYDWQTVEDGPRTQVFLREQRVEEFPVYATMQTQIPQQSQCVVHRSSIFDSGGSPDPKTRVLESCSMACAGAGSAESLCTPEVPGKKSVSTVYADPISGSVWSRPQMITTSYVDTSGESRPSSVSTYRYDGLALGLVGEKGNLHNEMDLVSMNPVEWVVKNITHDNDAGVPGPGNIVATDTPVGGASRAWTVEFDEHFQMDAIRERSPATTGRSGGSISHQVERTFDYRNGSVKKTIGVLGEVNEDVSGTVYDVLGRPTCEYTPGTSCDSSSGSAPTTEYFYSYGLPDHPDPIKRLNSVEVRRLEPNAPSGYLTTRVYTDALGRERIVTNEQNVSTDAWAAPSLQTVVVSHLEYGSNGKVARSFAEYVQGGSLQISAPPGTGAIEYSYVLNGNGGGTGYLDPAGRAWRVTQYDGTRTFSYYQGHAIVTVDGEGDTSISEMDEHGRVIHEVANGEGSQLTERHVAFNGRDEVVEEWFGGDLSTKVSKTHDLLGRLTSKLDPDSGIWTQTYDAAGNVVFTNDPETGQSVQSCYDELDRPVFQCARNTDTYDAQLCGASTPICSVGYSLYYDEMDNIPGQSNLGTGLLTTVEGPRSTHRYAYDVRRRIVHQEDTIDAISASTSYVYPASIDRVAEMTYPDGEVVVYTYDSSGQPRQLYAVSSTGLVQNFYVTDARYNLRGQPLLVRRGNGSYDEYRYHGADGNFRLSRRVSANDVASGPAQGLTYIDLEYLGYDGNGRIEEVVDHVNVSGGDLSMSAAYEYDGLGRLLAVSSSRSESFDYDSVGNITEINGKPFLVNPVQASSVGPHQPERFGDESGLHWTMTYDSNGNRTSRVRSDGAESHVYDFDGFGRLEHLTVNGQTKKIRYGLGSQRVLEEFAGVKRRFFGKHAEAEDGLVIKYYHFGDRLVATQTVSAPSLSDASVSSSFDPHYMPPEVYWFVMGFACVLLVVPVGRGRMTLGLSISQGGATGTAILVVSVMLPLVTGCGGAATTRHFHHNHVGSPVVITKYQAEVDRQYRYTAYGEVRRYDGGGVEVGCDSESRKEFTGYDVDCESGLLFAGARFYDPTQAQFLSLDPAEQFGNPYTYVGWDPINRIDPSGAFAKLILLVLAVVLIVATAVVAGVRAGSVSKAFETLGIGLAGLAAGVVVGIVVPPAVAAVSVVSQQAVSQSLAVAGVGTAAYGVATARDTAGIFLAGAGLALAAVGAAYALGGGRSAGATAEEGGSQGGAAYEGAPGSPESAPSAEALAEGRAAAVDVAKARAAPGTEVVGKDVWVGKSGDSYRTFASYERFRASGRNVVGGRFFSGRPGSKGFFGIGARPAVPGRIEIYNGAALPANNLRLTLPGSASVTGSFSGLQMARFVGAHEAAHSIGAFTEGAANRQAIAWGYLPR